MQKKEHKNLLKGSMSRDFVFKFLSLIQFPQALIICVDVILNLFGNWRRYSQIKLKKSRYSSTFYICSKYGTWCTGTLRGWRGGASPRTTSLNRWRRGGGGRAPRCTWRSRGGAAPAPSPPTGRWCPAGWRPAHPAGSAPAPPPPPAFSGLFWVRIQVRSFSMGPDPSHSWTATGPRCGHSWTATGSRSGHFTWSRSRVLSEN